MELSALFRRFGSQHFAVSPFRRFAARNPTQFFSSPRGISPQCKVFPSHVCFECSDTLGLSVRLPFPQSCHFYKKYKDAFGLTDLHSTWTVEPDLFLICKVAALFYSHGSCCCSCCRGHYLLYRCELDAAFLASEEWNFTLFSPHIVPAGKCSARYRRGKFYSSNM
jgi:hypothetical protein